MNDIKVLNHASLLPYIGGENRKNMKRKGCTHD